ncbi:MAG TPA: hypothetical protein VMW27_07840 [Thermoanaerobaculia bacterium]|nr:hypothetical protein [Thermoanaerobaculia bacterium]
MSRLLALALGVLWLLAACGPSDAPSDIAGDLEPKTPPGRGGTPAPPSPAPAVAKRQAPNPWTIDWRRWREPRERVLIGRGGIAMGAVAGPLRRYLFTEPERAREIAAFARAYAPFRWRIGPEELEFHGRGRVRVGGVERRMVLEWARQVAAEAAGVVPGSGYGLAFAWQLEGVMCEEVSVYLSAEVRSGPCNGDGAIAGRLAPEPLARVYSTFDRLAPFQSGEEAETGSTAASRLVFTGRGSQAASPAEVAAFLDLAAALHQEIVDRRPGALPPVPAEPAVDPKTGRKKKLPAPTPAPSPPPRLLLPPPSSPPLPEVILRDDALPPPPPFREPEARTSASF